MKEGSDSTRGQFLDSACVGMLILNDREVIHKAPSGKAGTSPNPAGKQRKASSNIVTACHLAIKNGRMGRLEIHLAPLFQRSGY